MGVGRQQEGEVCLPLREQRKLLTAHTLAELRGSRAAAQRAPGLGRDRALAFPGPLRL